MRDARRRARPRRRGVRRNAGARDRSRLARRGRRTAPRPRDLGPEDRRRAALAAGVFRVQLRAATTRARPAQPAGSDPRGRPLRCCAARSISSSITPDLDVLRVTDHKTGKNRSNPDLVVGRGTVLQPVLVQPGGRAGTRRRRCSKGGCSMRRRSERLRRSPNPDQPTTTARQGLQVLEIIDRAVESGFLAAAPDERACTWCDFRPVCGPREEERIEAQGARAPRRPRRAEGDAMRAGRDRQAAGRG